MESGLFTATVSTHFTKLRLYFFIAIQTAQAVQPMPFNGQRNLDNLGSNKEIQPIIPECVQLHIQNYKNKIPWLFPQSKIFRLPWPK